MTTVVSNINSQLDCDNKIIAKMSKDSPVKIPGSIKTASGQITPLSNYMLKLRSAKKILTKFYTTKESYGTVYFESGYGTGSHTYGEGFNGTYSTYNDTDSLSNLITNEVVPIFVSYTNNAYKSYKALYK